MSEKNLPKKLRQEDLKPGDVLLTHSYDGVSLSKYVAHCNLPTTKQEWETYLLDKHGLHYYVTKVDGGDYSHAAFYDGEKIIQSKVEGITSGPVEELMETHDRVDVFRFQGDPDGNCQQPGFTPEFPSDPVIKCARKHLDNNKGYDFPQLVLMFFILYNRQSSWKPNWAKYFVKRALTVLLDGLENMPNANLKQMFTCSEAVFRFFCEAQGKKYSLKVTTCMQMAKTGNDFNEADDENLEKLLKDQFIAEEEELYKERFNKMTMAVSMHSNDKPKESFHMNTKLFWQKLAERTYCVTPRSLQESPNLCCVGRLKDEKTEFGCPDSRTIR